MNPLENQAKSDTIGNAHYPINNVRVKSPDMGSKIIEALTQHRVCLLTDPPQEVKEAAQKLHQTSNRFIDSYYNCYQSTHQLVSRSTEIDPYGCKGFFPADKYFANCNNGDRLFLELEVRTGNEFNIKNNPIPALKKDQKLFIDNTIIYSQFMQDIARSVLGAIELKLNVQENFLQKAILPKFSINMTRYLPLTQKRILKLNEDKKLSILSEQPPTLKQFEAHSDICPITILCYPNKNFQGLEGEWNKQFLPFSLPKDCDDLFFILFTGYQLEVLTHGFLKPLVHRVTTTADSQKVEAAKNSALWRFVLGYFTFYARETIGPALTVSGDPLAPYHSSLALSEVKTADAVFEHDHHISSGPSTQLTQEILEAFPL